MKQTTIQFDKRKKEPVTIQRLQRALDSIANGTQLTEAIRSQGLGISFAKFLIAARILARIDHKTVLVLKAKLERKDFYRIMDIQTKDNLKRKKNYATVPYPLPKADTDMLGLVNMPSNEPVKAKRSYNRRYPAIAKKAVALPWWKRFLLYLLNQ